MARTTHTALLLALAASVAAFGCSKDDKSDADKETKQTTTESGAARAKPSANSGGKGPAIKVTETGAEPRKELRFKVNKGDSQKVEMTMLLSMKIDMEGMEMPETKLPPTKMVMKMDITDVMDNGDSKWEMSILSADVTDDPTVNPAVVSAARDGLKGITDFKGWAVIDNRGFVKDADITIPASADPQLKQMMESTRQSLDQLTAPLPEEPVGVGAKWVVDQTISQQGMTIQQTANYTVTSIEGDIVKADVELVQRADEQTVEMPGMPPGVKARLLQFDTKGSGRTTIDLTKVVPPEGEVEANMNMKTRIDMQGQSQMMSMSMGMKIIMSAVD
jgi:hypothetical protein